ncbi:5-methylcytosine restriction system specificity protein McrC [Thermococcus pacificus]|uniref:5-methylcytosine restriction system specificity protein McrC n=1 Tax=Thermococcus pacificus TaxID=71998 RepID=UPI0012FD5ABB|nr:hypothetical protein [Thermococcus pacificus]
MRIDLKEWQDISEIPEFKDNPFIPIRSIPPDVKKFIDIVDISPRGVKIKARDYVGVFPLSDDIILTVSPKAPVEDFLYMFYKAQGIKLDIKDIKKIAQAGRKYGIEHPNVFHFLITALLAELEQLKRLGFLKTSQHVTQDKIIKGKVLTKETINEWLRGNQQKVVCEKFELSKDNIVNSSIKFTLWSLINMYSNLLGDEIKNELFKKYLWFKDVSLPKNMSFIEEIEKILTFRALPNSRSYYYSILNLCMFFIANSTLEFRSPKRFKVRAFAVYMNKVFENYLYAVLKEQLGYEYRVKLHPTQQLFDDNNKYSLELDYLILKDDKPVLVVDAKYKSKPVTDDFYQILLYAEKFGIKNSLLIYPSWGKRTSTEVFRFKERQVHVMYYDLSDIKKSESTLREYIYCLVNLKEE